MPDYAVRISYAYDMVASLVSAWALRSKTMAVYEHTAAEAERVHVHLVMTGTNVDKKQLRNIGSNFVSLKGNELCSFKEFTGEERAYVYMTKGIHDPKYLLGFTKEQADEWKSKWKPEKKVEKVDKWTKIYMQFVDSQTAGIQYEETQAAQLFELKKLGRFFVLNVLGKTWTVDGINIYKMLVRTYCYDNEISIPSNDKLDW